MPDMNENAETQQEYFGVRTDNKETLYNAIKRIAELEKENAELKKACDETQELLDKQIEATYKLDKENAELESTFRVCEKNADTYYDKLQKAKKLLKQWVELYKSKLEGYPITPIQEQTEQFLNSEVKK